MAWKISFKNSAEKELGRIDFKHQKRIREFLESILDDPHSDGKPLTGDDAGLWRYRVGMYRIICDLKNGELIVEVVRVRKREDAYRKK